MNSVITALCGAISFMPPWIMLGVFGAIILLIVLFIAFKGFKRGVKFIILGLILMAAAYLVYLGVQIALWDVPEIIAFAIAWGPTVLFVLIVMTATFVNAKRGLRKSLILSFHAFCAGALCVALFFVTVYVEEVDAGSLKFFNLLAGENALQRVFGVSEDCSALKEVLAEYIANLIGSGMEGLTPYIITLVDMAYRIIFAVLSLIVYYFLIFILYIVYLLCYSQRKYKKTKTAEFLNGKTDRTYKKHHIGGGVVGFVRGIAVGLLSLSFLGSAFFMVAGGKGEGKLDNYDFDDDELNFYYQIYRSIEGYGAQGIFKILNAMSDATDTPYYLFAADLIFSGELNDEELDVSGNFKLREEIANLTGFARDTMELFMKYGSEELNALVGGEVTDSAFDTVVQVMTRTGFKEEFGALIDASDAQTYVINLSMAFVNVVVNNIDEFSFTADALGEDERELIKLIFKKGHLSQRIPDEAALIESGNTEGEIRPYLTVKHIINKSDVKTVLNVVLSVLAGEETGDTLELVKRIIPELGKLSILNTERKPELNPVFGRLYCLLENMYLTVEGEDGVTYREIAQDGIDWLKEINDLLEISSDTLTLYENIYGEDVEPLDIVRNMFDEEDGNYAENMRIYDKLCTVLSGSRILGKVLSTGYLYNTLYDALTGVSGNIYLPREINYNNTYDQSGKVTAYGETYRLLYGVKLLFAPENKENVNTLLGADDQTEIDDILNAISQIIAVTDGNGESLSLYLTESQILRSVISITLIEQSATGNTVYVPDSACEYIDGEYKNLITKDQLKGLLDNMDELVRFVEPFEGDSTDWQTSIDEFINDDNFYDLVKTNRIFEGTVAQLLNVKLGSDVLTIPKDLDGNIDAWITVGGKQGELINLIDALRVATFNVSDILVGDGFNPSSVIDKLKEMDGEELEIFFNSRVLHYTVSDNILNKDADLGGFVLVVPVNSRQLLKEDDVIDSLVKKSELISVFGDIKALGLSGGDEVDVTGILVKIVKDKSVLTRSKIIPASIVATMVENTEISDDLLAIPRYLKDKGAKRELEYFDSTNPWTEELPNLLDALDELLSLSSAEDGYKFDEEELKSKVSSLITELNDPSGIDPDRTKLRVLYGSIVFRNKITVELDSVLTEDVVDGFVVSYVKSGGYYTIEELQALSDAAKELGIDTTGGFEEFDFDSVNFNESSTLYEDCTRLQVIYRSDIVAGIITKNVKNLIAGNADVCDHPMAYRTDLHVYRFSEVESIIGLFGKINSEDEWDIEDAGDYVYDNESGEDKSYILAASISKQLLTTELIIPNTVVDGYSCVAPKELWYLLTTFNRVKEDYDGIESFEDWDDDLQVKIPSDPAVRDLMFSSAVMRATVTAQLLQHSSDKTVAVKAGNASVILDVRDGGVKRAMISKEQLEALACALDALNGEGELFEVPSFNNLDDISSVSDKLDILFESDMIRYRICNVLFALPNFENYVTVIEETAFNVKDFTLSPADTASAEDIQTALDGING